MRLAPWLRLALGGALLWALAACQRNRVAPPIERASEKGSVEPPSARDASLPAKPKSYGHELLLSETRTMRALESDGYDLGTLLSDPKARTNAELARGGHYSDVVRVLEDDVAASKRRDPSSGVGMAFGHRLFDAKYLRDADAKWELIGVSQRFDRAFIEPKHCGELRFLFRLRYEKSIRGTTISSRLPATAAVTFWNRTRQGDAPTDEFACLQEVEDWGSRVVDPQHPKLPRPDELALRFRSIELNVQTVRWPSTTRGDMAGHAEYTLRALVQTKDGAHLVPGPLENTPDSERARRDPEFRKQLLAWLVDKERVPALHAGTLRVPDEFLAKQATSVTPLGFARLQNRPYGQVFRKEEFSPVADETADTRLFQRSPAGMLRRLDQLSCQGCHEARSIAGFHFLGNETAPIDSVNAVLVGRSPHLVDELRRRTNQFDARLREGEAGVTGGDANSPGRAFVPIPFAERTSERGERGAHCVLGGDPIAQSGAGSRPSDIEERRKLGWNCATGLACRRDVGSDLDGIGECLAPIAMRGDPCEIGRISTSIDPHLDRVSKMESRPCPGVCESNRVGFPGGSCASSCAGLSKDDSCGAIPFLVGFNNCLGRGSGVSFEDCIKSNARPAGVQACDESRPCRDDYICARTGEGKGACMPPYFLFQLRVDGHP